MQWLAEHAPKSQKYYFTEFWRLTARNISEGAKIILKLLFLTQRRVLRKNQGRLSNRKAARMSYICFWMHWLAERAPKSAKDQFTKFG